MDFFGTLPDGTIAPSYLNLREATPYSQTDLGNTDYGFHIGKIVAVYPPNDPQNRNRKFFEYDVLCTNRNAKGLTYNIMYSNCRTMDLLGGKADYVRHTFRVSDAQKPYDQLLLDNSASVLLLCLNGYQKQGVIVGAYPNLNEADIPDSPNYRFSFNGFLMEVDSEGTVSLTRNGPTQDDGTPVDANDSAAGAKVVFGADGSVQVTAGGDSTNLNVSVDGVVIDSGEQGMMRGTKFSSDLSDLLDSLQSASNTMITSAAGLAGTPAAPVALILTAYAGSIIAAITTFKVQSNLHVSDKHKID